MRQTSLQAYNQIRKSLGYQEQMVLEAIRRMQPCTDRELKYDLGWEINRITGRRNGLLRKGWIKDSGKKHYMLGDRPFSSTLWEEV